ncbi:MAG: CotH kinase family protein [Rectinemataceae bacterium]
MKNKAQICSFITVSLVFSFLFSCAIAPEPLSDGAGSAARIRKFVVTSGSNPYLTVPEVQCSIEEGVDSGVIRATIPGGTSPLLSLRWSIAAGSLKSGGVSLVSGKVFDISVIKTVEAVDRKGRSRIYRLEIADSGIPTVYVKTKDNAPIISKDDWVDATIAIAGGGTAWAFPLPLSDTRIRGRGNSTWGMPKKPYRLSFSKAVSVFGMAESKTWVLLANYADKSLMRNIVAFETARILDGKDFVPHQYPVELYLNGEYQGAYCVGEQIETGKGRVDIGKPSGGSDTAFFLEVNMRSELEGGIVDKDFFVTSSSVYMDYKMPKAEDVTPAQREAIRTFVNKAEAAILSGKGYEEYIDVASFIDWIIIEELFKSHDSNFLSSVYLHRNTGGKLMLGPLWDFDLAAGNSDYGNIAGYDVKDSRGWFTTTAAWLDALMKNPEFKRAFAARWFDMRNVLESTAMGTIDTTERLLSRVQEPTFEKWKIMGIYVWPNPPELVAADSHAKQVDALTAWLKERFIWLDSEIGKMRD